MRIAIYARVSVDKSSQTTDQQVSELQKYCELRGWDDVDVFTDRISGGKSQRVELDKMLKALRKHRYKVVLCQRIDRLARSLSHFALLLEEFKLHGVSFVVPSQGISTETSNPAGQLTMNILMCLSEFERTLASQRVKSKLDWLKSQGKSLGRPKKVESHLPLIRSMRQQGKKLKQIAEATKLSIASVSLALKAG